MDKENPLPYNNPPPKQQQTQQQQQQQHLHQQQEYQHQHQHQQQQDDKQANHQQSAPKRRGTVPLTSSKGPPPHFYSPSTSILTIGDGDLSFSLSISQWIQYKHHKNINKFVATTYDSFEELLGLYKMNVRTTIKKLEENGVKVLHGVDVGRLGDEAERERLDGDREGFDRIVWNFPHAGFPQKNYGPGFEWQQGFHEKHISLISLFFHHSHKLLRKDGLLLMAHKTVQPFSLWNIPQIAHNNGYKLLSQEPFCMDNYPGYENRRGAGRNGGKRFPIEDAVQYVFG